MKASRPSTNWHKKFW